MDRAAQLVFDLKTKQLTVESQASESAILNAIVKADYQYESLVTEKIEAALCCGHCS